MEIVVNGEQRRVADNINIKQLLAELGLQDKKIAVELNEEIIPASLHEQTQVKEQDSLEIVHAIGGG